MKEHAIIPVFIPHRGCPNDCVFCNQRAITARTADVTAEDVRNTIEEWLTTLEGAGTIEVAFYGGSFTGLTIEEQSYYLEVAHGYKKSGRISKIHLSTRPDYIDRPILDNLKAYEVDTVELGVQSFDDEVLKKSNRGHDSKAVYRAVELLKEYGFEYGIQLMIGLPGDSLETCIFSAREAARLRPHLARLYPTIVIDDTELFNQYVRGEYIPLSREEAIERTREMYLILAEAGITIMRVGLKSTDIIGDGGAINGGTYHPAFRQLVEGRIARDRLDEQFARIRTSHSELDAGDVRLKVDAFCNGKWYSNMIGNSAENRRYFEEKYPEFSFKFRVDDSLRDMEFVAREK